MSDEELLRRNEIWDRAIQDRDPDAARSVLADDYALVLIHPVRTVVSRDDWLGMLPGYVVHKWEVEEQVMDVSGDLAVVLQRIRMRATVNGADRSGLFAISDIWRRIDGEWRIWRRHSTPFTAGELK